MVDVTDATFQTHVLEQSMRTPVVIDLWATWCQPCVSLGPIIERVVEATNGKVVLAKVDVDANPQIASAFKVQSIPAVFAMDQQRIVAEFLGARPEEFVAEWVNKLLPTAEQTEVERLFALGDEASLRAALELEPDNEPVSIALAELLVADGRSDDAKTILAKLPETPEVRRVLAMARTGLADASGLDVEAELLALLDRVKDDDEARQRFVDLLAVLGPDDERTADYRRKLTSKLF
ncbi:MAG TPA: tetratricopeptide repeat protein [Microthrixaceae bacterium]|nr:tetratricopeptide repeat protein [Microthrixaceae bacterium]HNI34370.1 tetratricopeptide repeat protein [Microthrixaceae bacterium]